MTQVLHQPRLCFEVKTSVLSHIQFRSMHVFIVITGRIHSTTTTCQCLSVLAVQHRGTLCTSAAALHTNKNNATPFIFTCSCVHLKCLSTAIQFLKIALIFSVAIKTKVLAEKIFLFPRNTTLDTNSDDVSCTLQRDFIRSSRLHALSFFLKQYYLIRILNSRS